VIDSTAFIFMYRGLGFHQKIKLQRTTILIIESSLKNFQIIHYFTPDSFGSRLTFSIKQSGKECRVRFTPQHETSYDPEIILERRSRLQPKTINEWNSEV